MKYFLSLLLLVTASLGGCTAIQSWVTDPKVLALETQVQQAAVALCGYLVSVESVAAIVLAGNPALVLPEAIAGSICAAVQPKAGVMAAQPMVGGVRVTGKFVK